MRAGTKGLPRPPVRPRPRLEHPPGRCAVKSRRKRTLMRQEDGSKLDPKSSCALVKGTCQTLRLRTTLSSSNLKKIHYLYAIIHRRDHKLSSIFHQTGARSSTVLQIGPASRERPWSCTHLADTSKRNAIVLMSKLQRRIHTLGPATSIRPALPLEYNL